MAANQITVDQMLANMKPKGASVAKPARDLAMPALPFDPLERGAMVESVVMKGNARMYYRFRHARFYGGICTADAVGCCLLCDWGSQGKCWNFAKNQHPESATGVFCSPEEVAAKLIAIAEKHDCWNFRISGCEPFLGAASTAHSLAVMRLLKKASSATTIVIESNAVWLGAHPGILDELRKAAGNDVRLRISLKGENEEQSQRLTGAKGAFALQVAAIQAAADRRIHCRVAVASGIVDPVKVSLPPQVGVEKEKISRRWG